MGKKEEKKENQKKREPWFCRYPSTMRRLWTLTLLPSVSVCLSPPPPIPVLALSVLQYLFRLSVCLPSAPLSPSWLCRYPSIYSVCLFICPLPRPGSVDTPVPIPSVCLSPLCLPPRPGSVGTPVLILSVCPLPPPCSVDTSVPIPSVCLPLSPSPSWFCRYPSTYSVCLSVSPSPVLALSVPQYLFRLSVSLCPPPRPGSVGTPVLILSVCPLPPPYSVDTSVPIPSVCLSPSRPHPRSRRVGAPVPILSVCWNPLSPSPETPRLLYSTSAVLASRALGTRFSRLAVPYTTKVLRYKRVKVGLYPSPPNQIMYRRRRFAPPATS